GPPADSWPQVRSANRTTNRSRPETTMRCADGATGRIRAQRAQPAQHLRIGIGPREMVASPGMSMSPRLTLALRLMLMMTTTISEGKTLGLGPVHSRFLGGARQVQVYLPPSYDAEPRRRYPVLYLHDGQNMFSSAGSDCCFGWGNWELDRTADRLVEE